MSPDLDLKNDKRVFEVEKGEVPYLSYRVLKETGTVRHGFSTRLGGVSEGCYSSMNLSFERGDDPEAVRENFRRIGQAIGVDITDMVLSRQTHTANVRIVTEEDKGKGIVRERDYTDVDGFVTDRKGICLVTSFADCVPLYFVDPQKRVIGLSHSGWRGTVKKIGKRTVEIMTERFGCDPADILACIGPSICVDCYEVSEDVIERVKEQFPSALWSRLFYAKGNGKYQLDLWKTNQEIFLEAGIRPEHIEVTNVCTHCNSSVFYSHRMQGDKRGNLCAFLALK